MEEKEEIVEKEEREEDIESKKPKKRRKKKKKIGFTLIELLAVIIILGILITVAVVGVSRYIKDSRKDSYVATAKSYISSALNYVNSGGLGMFDEGVTYYLPEKCIPMEKVRRSPNGEFKEAYMVVTYDKKEGFTYYWMSRDNINEGFYLTKGDLLSKELVQHSMEELEPNIGINNRSKIMVLNNNCNLEGVSSTTAEFLMNKDNFTVEDLNNPIEQVDLLPMIGEYNTIWSGLNKKSIESIKVENHKNAPGNAIRSWDISANKDGSAMAWYLDSDGNHAYELYLGGDGGLAANPNSSQLFADFIYLEAMDLKNLNTSKVTNMSKMFFDGGDLAELDISNFDTSNVTDMSYMFCNCGYFPENTNISDFNEPLIGDLGLKYSNNSEVFKVEPMVKQCLGFGNLKLGVFDMSKVSNMNRMFGRYDDYNYYSESLIQVKTPATRDKLISAFPELTNNIVLY